MELVTPLKTKWKEIFEMRKTISNQSIVCFILYSFIVSILLGTITLGSAYAQIVGLWHFDEGSGEVLKDSGVRE